MIRSLFWGWLIVGLVSSPGVTAEWTTITGRVVLSGEAPERPDFVVNKDVKAFPDGVPDERLVVNEKDGGIANVVVYLRTARGEQVAVHPHYEKSAGTSVELKMKNGRFVPHITLVRTSQSLTQRNLDSVAHCTLIQTIRNRSISQLVPSSKQSPVKFQYAESIPIVVNCAIHPWMRGFIVVRDNPYMAVTDQHGRFEIKHIPAGERQFQFWHEEAGYLRDADLGEWRTDKRGRAVLTLQPGTLSLGEIRLEPQRFERPATK